MGIFGWFRRRNADAGQAAGAGTPVRGAGDPAVAGSADGAAEEPGEGVGIPRQTVASEAADSQDQEATK